MGSTFAKRRGVVVVLLAVALSVLTDHTCDGQEKPEPGQGEDYHVKIINALSESAVLTVNCWRADRGHADDLGSQEIYSLADYTFDIHADNTFLTTYKCRFDWLHESHEFLIFYHARDMIRGIELVWSITSSGPCVFNNSSGGTICYEWS
ncbi:S-protein homolog 3-like [Punica granatum]|uniref:S-protein homolog n=2 Tax=Punica granatum TaxID=22663 RepID=A0A218VXA9_PUNGR|nr:S-protein homolog 3-like [Punica granatum]OWM65204.1 hypothetical protein CDL15_Pgr008793 [Punica granatum]PKI31096.1 hypothetical protein CRG98_048515 [Punica granatum]